MAYDIAIQEPQPPQGTYTGGEAVQSRTDPDGTEYIFDNDAGNWVPVGMRDMSQPNAADNTRALATGLRSAGVPEAGPAPITPPPQAPIAPPPAAVQSPQAQVTPPQGPMPAPPPATDPALAGRLGASPPAVMPPLASPEKIAQMRALQPVKSTYNPPSQPQISDYQLREYKFLVQSGKFKPADAALAVGLNPKAIQAPKNHVVGKYLVGPDGNVLFSPPKEPEKPKIHFGPKGEVLQEQDGNVNVIRPAEPGEQKYHGAHVKIPAGDGFPEMSGPSDNPDIIARQKQIAAAKAKQEADDAAEAAKPGLLKRGWDAIRGNPTPTTGTTPPAVVPPAGKSQARVRVKNPQGKIGTIPADQVDDAIASGWTRM